MLLGTVPRILDCADIFSGNPASLSTEILAAGMASSPFDQLLDDDLNDILTSNGLMNCILQILQVKEGARLICS